MTRVRIPLEHVDYPDLWSFAGYGTESGDPHADLANCPDFWVYWDVQISFGKGFGKVASIADLSAGDARITKALAEYSGIEPILGDIAPGYSIQAPLSVSVLVIPPVELFVCTNTLEHLEDPEADVGEIRKKASKLLTSASLDEPADMHGDHYWTWAKDDVEEILRDAGWEI